MSTAQRHATARARGASLLLLLMATALAAHGRQGTPPPAASIESQDLAPPTVQPTPPAVGGDPLQVLKALAEQRYLEGDLSSP